MLVIRLLPKAQSTAAAKARPMTRAIQRIIYLTPLVRRGRLAERRRFLPLTVQHTLRYRIRQRQRRLIFGDERQEDQEVREIISRGELRQCDIERRRRRAAAPSENKHVQ